MLSLGRSQSLLLDFMTLFSEDLRTTNEWINSGNGQKSELSFKYVFNDSIHSLIEYEGRVVLLNFWATWCSPCLKELPALNALRENYDQSDLVIISISDEDRETLVNFEKKNSFKTINGYIHYKDKLNEPFRHMRRVRPLAFLIDRNGVIREAYMGVGDYKFFKKKIEKYL